MYFFYYMPVGVDTTTKRFPVVTVMFALICTFVFIGQKFFADSLPFNPYDMIYYPALSPLVTTFTAALLHFGWMHLIGNLVYMVLFGWYLEDRLGSPLFLLLFVGSAVIGNAVQGYYNIFVLDTYVGIIGASGAVSGILGAFLIRLYRTRVRIAWWVFAPLLAYTRAGRSYIPVIFALALWVLLQVVRSLLQFEGASTNVAHMTHLSGFAFGLLLMLATGNLARGRQEGHLIRANHYLRKGEYYGAGDELSAYLNHRPEDGDAYAQLARVMVQTEDKVGAKANYMRACELMMRAGGRAAAEDVYEEATRGFPDFVLSADPQLNMALGLERNLKYESALRAYQMFAGVYPRHEEVPLALLRSANLFRDNFKQMGEARRCYTQLIERYPGDVWVDFAIEQVRLMA